jgi:hypothetical protein
VTAKGKRPEAGAIHLHRLIGPGGVPGPQYVVPDHILAEQRRLGRWTVELHERLAKEGVRVPDHLTDEAAHERPGRRAELLAHVARTYAARAPAPTGGAEGVYDSANNVCVTTSRG